MVKLTGKTKLVSAIEPEEGGTYEIITAEEIKTAVQAFGGIRVQMKSMKQGDDQEYATMLWMRPEASRTSKLGAFLAAFTKALDDEEAALDTDNWLEHKIRIISWKPKAREVLVID